MHFVFIGGTRFIGHAAAAAAVWRGHSVSLMHRGKHPTEVRGVREVLVDRQDPSALCRELRRLAPDVVVDTRAMTQADAEITALALEVAGVPGVVLSSQDVYAQFGRLNGLPGPEPEALVSESSPLTIPFPFRELGGHEAGPDYDKKLVEKTLKDACVARLASVCVLRLPAVYGNRDPRRRFGALIDRLDSGARDVPCKDGAKLRLTHAHVRDVAHAIVLAGERSQPGYHVFNLGEAETPTMRARADAIARTLGLALVWREGEALPPGFELFGSLPNDFVASSAAFRSAFDFREITREDERIADLIEFCRRSRK